MTQHRSDFVTYETLPEPELIHGIMVHAVGKGKVMMYVPTSDGPKLARIENVLHIPDLAKQGGKVTRLFSQRASQNNQGSAAESPVYIGSRDKSVIHFANFDIDLDHDANPNLLTLHTRIIKNHEKPVEIGLISDSVYKAVSRDTMHRRIGHLSSERVERLCKDSTDIFYKPGAMTFYPDCAVVKSTRQPSGKGTTSRRDGPPFSKVGTDIWCTTQESINGYRYMLGFTCYSTGYVVIYTMRTKDEAPVYLSEFLKWVSMQNYSVDEMRCDSDAVFAGADFANILGHYEVNQTFSAPYTPSENSIAERTWANIMASAKAMLKTARLPLSYWEFAAKTACYIHNRVFSRGVGGIPMTLITGLKTHLSHLRTFGCPAYVHVPAHQRKKMEDSAWKGVFVGYPTYTKGYLVYNPTTGRTIVTKHVRFDESFDGRISEEGTPTHYSNFDTDDPSRPLPRPDHGPSSPGNPPDSHPLPDSSDSEEDDDPPAPGPAAAIQQPQAAAPISSALQRPQQIAAIPQVPAANPGANPQPEQDNADEPAAASLETVPPAPTPSATAPQQPQPPSSSSNPDSVAAAPPSSQGSTPYKDALTRSSAGGTSAQEGTAYETADQEGTSPERILQPGEGSSNEQQQNADPSTPEPDPQQNLEQQPAPRRSERDSHPPERYGFEESANLSALHPYLQQLSSHLSATDSTPVDPPTRRQALNGPHAAEWRQAEIEEINSLKGMKTYVLVPRSEARNIITCKWVYKVKHNSDGSVARYKARLVARGFLQQESIDYHETFAPTAKFVSIRLLVALACSWNWPLHQCDIETAFLWANIEDDTPIYMEQPEGYVSDEYPDYVCKLLKSIYGLKQSAHLFTKLLAKQLKKRRFRQLKTDPSVFVLSDDDGTCAIVACYIDDLLILGRNMNIIDQIKSDLKLDFTVKDLGPVAWILGIAAERDMQNNTFTLHQRKYINDMVAKYGQLESATRNLPYAGGDDKPLESPPCDSKQISQYRSLVGSLLYCAVATRVDIVETVSRLCRCMSAPTVADLRKAIRCLQYLKGTKDLGLQFSGEDGLKCYCDSNWAGATEKRRSRSGYVFVLNNAAIIFRSLLQKSQALSTAEAEYVALCAATQDACFLLQMLEELGIPHPEPIVVLEDNQACVSIATSEIASPKLKHIDLRYHFTRDMIEANKIRLVYCPTYHQAADILTKPTDLLTFLRHRSTLMGHGTH